MENSGQVKTEQPIPDITLKVWKRESTSPVTIVEVPSQRMLDVLLMVGGRKCGMIRRPEYDEYYHMVEMPDSRLENAITILKQLKAKGVDITRD